MININMNNEWHTRIILSDHLFHKGFKAARDRKHGWYSIACPLISIWVFICCWTSPMSLTLVNRRSKCSITWSHRVFSSSVFLDILSKRSCVYFDGLIGAVVTDRNRTKPTGDQTTGSDCSSPWCCLSRSPPPGSEAEPRNLTREHLPRNPNSRTLPRQLLRTNLTEPTTKFYTRTNVLQPSLFIQMC